MRLYSIVQANEHKLGWVHSQSFWQVGWAQAFAESAGVELHFLANSDQNPRTTDRCWHLDLYFVFYWTMILKQYLVSEVFRRHDILKNWWNKIFQKPKAIGPLETLINQGVNISEHKFETYHSTINQHKSNHSKINKLDNSLKDEKKLFVTQRKWNTICFCFKEQTYKQRVIIVSLLSSGNISGQLFPVADTLGLHDISWGNSQEVIRS